MYLCSKAAMLRDRQGVSGLGLGLGLGQWNLAGKIGDFMEKPSLRQPHTAICGLSNVHTVNHACRPTYLPVSRSGTMRRLLRDSWTKFASAAAFAHASFASGGATAVSVVENAMTRRFCSPQNVASVWCRNECRWW